MSLVPAGCVRGIAPKMEFASMVLAFAGTAGLGSIVPCTRVLWIALPMERATTQPESASVTTFMLGSRARNSFV